MDPSDREPLPLDAVFEILARTSLQTLDTCKVVSKEWEQLIWDSSFLTFYGKKTRNLFGYIVQGLVANKHVNKFVSPYKSQGSFSLSPFKFDDMKIEASSPQGILCCVRSIGRNYRYYVCKPTTSQWQALPNPKRPHSTIKAALVVLSSSPLHYKIVRVSEPRFLRFDCYHYRCEIFDSKTWAWKEVEDILLSHENSFDNNPAVCAGGLICLLTNDRIVAFHKDQATHFTMSLPKSLCKNGNYQSRRITEYQGKLGLVWENDGFVELWVLKDHRSGRWQITKGFNIDVQYPSPVCFYNSEILLTKTYGGVIFWNSQNSSFNEIKLPNLRFAVDIFPFRSDWETVNLREENFSVNSKKCRSRKSQRYELRNEEEAERKESLCYDICP